MAETQLEQYLDLRTFLERYPQFKEGQLRWLVVKKKENGLEHAIRRLGRRLYLHVPSFLSWVEQQRG